MITTLTKGSHDDFYINAYNNITFEKIAANGAIIPAGTALKILGNYLEPAGPGDIIEGISISNKAYPLDNQTGDKLTIVYRPARRNDVHTYLIQVNPGQTATQANVGKFFNLIVGTDRQYIDLTSQNDLSGQYRIESVKNGGKTVEIRIWETITGGGGGGGGATSFVGLSDVPHSYTGYALKGLRANASETGLEFYTPFSGAYSALTGIPSTFAPSSHNHNDLYYIKSEVDTFIAGRQIAKGVDDFYVTGAEKTKLSNTSGTNTGDETTATIKTKLGITTLSGSNTGDQDLSGLVLKNATITGATKTKITYDGKGLVTAGADATTADIADSTNKRYVTDTQLTVIGNTSGTNTGDETITTIKTKLGITTLSGSNTGDQDLSSYITTATANTNYQPKNADLTAIAALSGTNTLYYRSGANTRSAVTIGTNLTFSGGTLSASGGGGGGGSTYRTAVPGSPTRTSDTTFTLTDTGNAGLYNLLLCRLTVVKRTESLVVKQAMVSVSSYASNTVTVTIVGDTMASIDASSLKYGMIKARTYKFAVAGTIGSTGTNIANTVMTEGAMKIFGADIWAGTAGNGTTSVDIKKNGTTMFTTQPSITTTSQTGLGFTANNGSSTASGDIITLDQTAVASTTKIVDEYVNLYYTPLYNLYLA